MPASAGMTRGIFDILFLKFPRNGYSGNDGLGDLCFGVKGFG